MMREPGEPAERLPLEEGAQECQRLEVALRPPDRLADRQELAEEDGVAPRAAAVEPSDGRAHQRAVEPGCDRPPALRGLRIEVAGVVRLVPERPHVDAREAARCRRREAPELARVRP